jgi:hypothetical protein
MTTKFWLSYLAISVVSVTAIGFTADCQHRNLWAPTLNVEDISFSASGFANETLTISLAKPNPVDCQSVADYFAHDRDGEALVLREGFTSVSCGNIREKIDRPEDGDKGIGNSQG